MIVSERAPPAPSALSRGRRSEPRIISVWALPGSVSASWSLPSLSSRPSPSASTILSTSWKAATAVARRRREDAQQRAQQEALPESGAGDVFEHQAIRSGRSSLPIWPGSRLTNSTKARRYSPSDRIDTHSSGP